jgi:O-antigen/teichoic acid export membrane protein
MLSQLKNHDYRATLAHLRAKLQDSPLAHRLAKGAAWSLFGAVSSRLLVLASTAIIVRILGKEIFGEFGMVQSTLLLLGTFAGMGLGVTATKHTAEFRLADPARAGRLLGLLIASALVGGLVVSVFGWWGSDWLATHVLDRASLAPYLKITAILVMIGALDGVFTAALAGFEAFKRIARNSILVALVSPVFTVPMVYFYGLSGAVYGLVASMSLQMLLDVIALVRECGSHDVRISLNRASFSEWPVLVHFALPALAANVLVMPATWLANVFLVNTGSGYAGLGSVNVVNTFNKLAIYLPTILLAPTLAVLAHEINKPAAVRNTLRYALGMSALTVLPIALMITCLGKYLLGTIYGPEFAGEGAMLACAMTIAAIQATGLGLGAYVNASGRMWLGLSINMLFGVAFVALSYAMIPKFGPLGYLGAMAIAYLMTIIVTYGGFSITLPDIMRCYPLIRALIMFAVLMGAAVYVNEHFGLLLCILCALVLGSSMAIALAVPLLRNSRLAASLLSGIKSPPVAEGGL